MNERIDELLWQAGGYTKIHNPNDSFLDGRYAITQEQLDKFAELIVKECIRVPYDMWDKAELNADVAVKIEHRIKEHFGVEE